MRGIMAFPRTFTRLVVLYTLYIILAVPLYATMEILEDVNTINNEFDLSILMLYQSLYGVRSGVTSDESVSNTLHLW